MKSGGMPAYEVARTLVKSPPELWDELQGTRLPDAIEGASVRPTQHGEELAWEAKGVRGKARIEPSAWGTKVTLTAEVEEEVARGGLWSRLRGGRPEPTSHTDMEDTLERVLDQLGADHKKPFTRDQGD